MGATKLLGRFTELAEKTIKNIRNNDANPENSDESKISLYVITTCSNVQVVRIKKVITKDGMS